MNKKIIGIVTIVIGIVLVLVVLIKSSNTKLSVNDNQQNVVEKDLVLNTENQAPLKEFSMTSFVDMSSGSPKPRFSLKEITVNKGDRVRIKITVTSGMHDFKIDEYGVYVDTQLNKESIVEFVADKSGNFVYYCTKPGHRQNGQWGTLKVI